MVYSRRCAACSDFRAAQPPLRCLLIGFHKDWPPQYVVSASSLCDQLCILLPQARDIATPYEERKRDTSEYIKLSKLSTRHARELTHLGVTAVHHYDYRTGEGEQLPDLGPETLPLTELKVLYVEHPGAGWSKSEVRIRDVVISSTSLEYTST